MEIIEGKVSNYKGHGDIHRFYGKIGEEIKYYFLDFSPLSNGNMIATTELVEAIDSEVPASHIGLVDSEGNVVIPLENKTVKPITGDILLVERSNPLSQNVLDAIEASKDTKLATGLVSITNTCKNKVMEKLGVSSELIFHNQLSEASIFDINGNNLVNDEYFSYIGVNADKVYLGKNLVDAPITEYSMLPPEIQSNTMVSDNEITVPDINVEEAANNAEEIKEAVDGEMAAQEEQENAEVPPVEEAPVEETPAEVPTDVPAEEPVAEVVPEEVPVEETAPVEEPVPTEEAAPTEEASPVEETPTETPTEEAPTENTEEAPVETSAEGFDNIDLPDVPVVGTPEVDPLENTSSISPEEVAHETAEVSREETVEEPSVNIVNDENQDNVDDVLNSLFGNIPNNIAEPVPVEVPTDVPTEEPAAEPTPEETPVEEPAAEEAPIPEEAPVEVPVEEPVAEETPIEEPVPEEEPIPEEAPVEVPVEEPVTEEAPIEEPAAEEEPIPEEVPVEVPVEKPVAEETPIKEPVEENNDFSDLIKFNTTPNEEKTTENTDDYFDSNDNLFSDFNVDKIVRDNEYEFNDYDYATDNYEDNTDYSTENEYNTNKDDIHFQYYNQYYLHNYQ